MNFSSVISNCKTVWQSLWHVHKLFLAYSHMLSLMNPKIQLNRPFMQNPKGESTLIFHSIALYPSTFGYQSFSSTASYMWFHTYDLIITITLQNLMIVNHLRKGLPPNVFGGHVENSTEIVVLCIMFLRVMLIEMGQIWAGWTSIVHVQD